MKYLKIFLLGLSILIALYLEIFLLVLIILIALCWTRAIRTQSAEFKQQFHASRVESHMFLDLGPFLPLKGVVVYKVIAPRGTYWIRTAFGLSIYLETAPGQYKEIKPQSVNAKHNFASRAPL